MPNWAFGNVKVTGTREGVKSFVERFISSDDQSTVPGKRFFARSFSEQKREQSVKDAMEEFEGKADNETAEHSFLIMFAWSVWSCMIDGYPQRNDAECITLSEACMEDHVAVEIRSTETGMCFEEHVTCDEDGNLNHAERDLSRCKCRNCGEISRFGSFEDLDDTECSECGECGFDRCEEERIMALNLNYTPNKLVDITTLTEDQWLDWRRKGIGGSDVAVALNSSPYRTARELYYDKIGVVMADEGPDKSITFQIGHLLEDVVDQIFAKKTGLSVFEDHWMYQHPIFPFLIADVDRFVMLLDGRKAILECKTAHYDMQFKWANGSVPRHYELQVRHYMAVMNIDVAFIACLFSNNENDFVWQKIEGDLDEEENTIMELEAFWRNHVLARVEPPLVEKPDAVLESLRRYFGPADKSEPSVDLDCKFLGSLREILNLKEEKKVLDTQSKALETRIKSLYAPIVEQMGTACKASCEHGGECFRVTYNPQYREGINKDRLSALRAQYPEIYDEFVDQTELRIFKVVKTAIA